LIHDWYAVSLIKVFISKGSQKQVHLSNLTLQ
jgi:hypothetical protein